MERISPACYYDESAPADVLDAYLGRLVQYVGPTPEQAARPEAYSSRIQAKRTGRRDDELASIDVAQMTGAAASCLASHLARTGRLDAAIRKFPNLAPLREVGRP